MHFEGAYRQLGKCVEGLGATSAMDLEASTGFFFWAEQIEAKGPVRFTVSPPCRNTSSTKCMIDILDELRSAPGRRVPVQAERSSHQDNERTKDTIEEFRDSFTMPFSVTPGSPKYGHGGKRRRQAKEMLSQWLLPPWSPRDARSGGEGLSTRRKRRF